MKKRVLIAVISIIAIISLLFVFVACNKDVEVDPGTTTKEGISTTTFFTAAFNVEDPKISISLMSVADNVEIYSRSSTGAEMNPYNIDIASGSFVDTTAKFEYREDAFSETTIKNKLFTGKIDNPKEYLGITDNDVTIANGKVVIELKGTSSNYTLKSVDVTYDLTVDGLAYKATITITP